MAQSQLESSSRRVEQLAARLALTDREVVIHDGETYLCMCTRNADHLRRHILKARTQLEFDHLDHAQPEAEYPREFYDADHGPQVSETVRVHMKKDLEMEEDTVGEERTWNINSDRFDDLKQVEVFVDDQVLERALDYALGQQPDHVVRTLRRSESQMRTLLYDARNTLFVVINPNDDYLRAAIGMAQQLLTTTLQGQELGAELRCEISARLVTLTALAWTKMLDEVSSRQDRFRHVVHINLKDHPPIVEVAAPTPSQWIGHEWIGSISESVISSCLLRVVKHLTLIPKHESHWQSITGSRGQLRSRLAVGPDGRSLHLEVANEPGYLTVETLAEAFERHFKTHFISGEYYSELEVRESNKRTAEPNNLLLKGEDLMSGD